MEKATAKGLHFTSGQYAPIRRTGFLTVASDEFRAEDGKKAMTSMNARGITATFNPLGIFLRRWQLDEVKIESGDVGIQTYAPKPEPTSAKPWYSIFLPNRVYMKRVESEPVDVTWRLRGKRSGFFATRLLITPHGRDFNYQATGGTLKMALLSDLRLRQTRFLITKKLLTLHNLELTPLEENGGLIHAEGRAGIGADRSVDFKLKFDHIPVRAWLPTTWREHVAGEASGKVHWTGENPKLESSSGNGGVQVRGGRVVGLPFLEKLATITTKKAIEELELNECSAEVEWHYRKIDIRNIAIEDKGKFRIEGALSIDDESLGGAIQLGAAREYLGWLPNAEEVFTREQAGYVWTTIHLSGTMSEPKQDLSERVIDVLKQSPGAFLGLIFRQVGDWLKNAFDEE